MIGQPRQPHVVIAHDFSPTFGGAERIAAEIAAEFPEAEFWSLFGTREVAARMGVSDRFASVIPEWRPIVRHFRLLAPVYPAVVRARRLPAADVLLTSSFAFAHGFRTENDAPQVCYCYSPLRFAWTMTSQYRDRFASGRVGSTAFAGFASLMRGIDRRAAANVTRYVAESHYVADQIRTFYGRDADVVWPPVDTELFRQGPPGHDGYFLFCGRLVEPYKRPTLVVDAFRALPKLRLLVAGDGPELDRLRRSAPPNVEFLGQLSDDRLVPLMQRAAAVVFPSVDDFGLIPVETMACGRPVIAYAAGGALETIVAGETGEFFDAQELPPLVAAIEGFDPDAYDPVRIRLHAEGWGAPRFRTAIREIVEEVAGESG